MPASSSFHLVLNPSSELSSTKIRTEKKLCGAGGPPGGRLTHAAAAGDRPPAACCLNPNLGPPGPAVGLTMKMLTYLYSVNRKELAPSAMAACRSATFSSAGGPGGRVGRAGGRRSGGPGPRCARRRGAPPPHLLPLTQLPLAPLLLLQQVLPAAIGAHGAAAAHGDLRHSLPQDDRKGHAQHGRGGDADGGHPVRKDDARPRHGCLLRSGSGPGAGQQAGGARRRGLERPAGPRV